MLALWPAVMAVGRQVAQLGLAHSAYIVLELHVALTINATAHAEQLDQYATRSFGET